MARFLYIMMLLGLFSCGSDDSDMSDESRQEEETAFDLEELTDRPDVVWGFDWLDTTHIIFSEREGRIGILDTETNIVTDVNGVPEVFAEGEGGLLDVRFHNNFVYFCYAEPDNGQGRNALARAQVINNELVNFQKLFTANHTTNNTNHFGCRIEFDDSGHMFLSLGERGDRPRSQDFSSHLGKILRLNLDGSIPSDNPFVNRLNSQREIYSLGHRNVQGLAFKPGTNELWASELGPNGGDEINIIQSGENYGWPFISFGRDPGGLIEATRREGNVDPITFWDPSISPSAIAFYQGDLFMCNLSGQHLRRLKVDGRTVTEQEILFENLGWRFRNVRVGPDGLLYFSTDEGRIVKLLPIE